MKKGDWFSTLWGTWRKAKIAKSGHDTIRDIFIQARQGKREAKRGEEKEIKLIQYTSSLQVKYSHSPFSFILLLFYCFMFLCFYVSYAPYLIWWSGDELLLCLCHILSYNLRNPKIQRWCLSGLIIGHSETCHSLTGLTGLTAHKTCLYGVG